MRRSKLARRPNGDVRTKYFPLRGGLDLVDAPIAIPSGMCLAAVNYELQSREGYRRIDGYERFDGQSSPSNASYWIQDFNTGDITEPQVGATAHGITSGAQGEVGLVVLTSGSWTGGDAVGYLVLFGVIGSFQDTEIITFTGVGDGFDSGYSNGFG